MADTNKKEYTSNLHPKGDMDTTVYPNVKSENIIDKDTTAYTAGKVPDSSLVSRSLDGLNENLETTKIQVVTNKKNIETLQGNYTGLQYQVNTNSSDIALTKTQVETNKTNIAKNTQDIATNTQNIENLSAVMPTDINVDSDYNLILEHDGKEITGQKKLFKTTFISDINSNSFYSVFSKNGNKYTKNIEVTLQNAGQSRLGNIYFRIKKNNYDFIEIGKTGGGEGVAYISSYLDGYKNKSIIFGKAPQDGVDFILPNYSGTIALTSDLATKQSTLYRHTVKISKATDDGKTSITFTTSSEKNTPIDSIQDLTTVFGNTDLSASGATYLISSSQWEFYNKIHVGTSITDTTVDYINKDDVGTYNFTDMFGTTGFTITDNVTAM